MGSQLFTIVFILAPAVTKTLLYCGDCVLNCSFLLPKPAVFNLTIVNEHFWGEGEGVIIKIAALPNCVLR